MVNEQSSHAKDRSRLRYGIIAAYKICEIVRLSRGRRACQGLRPSTQPRSWARPPSSAYARGGCDRPVRQPSDPIHHISLAKEPDAVLVAPATANVIAKWPTALPMT
ncbi:MAG: flavoprotein [Collinsella stercoris]|uniref:flavoprotein n=1 Tax=Collinsella stercoris TaxID=147206 RepID=UPI003991D984